MPGTRPGGGLFRPRPWMRSELLLRWVQLLAIVVGSLWAVYTFYWQAILVPGWAPAHINLEVTLTPVPDRQVAAEGRDMSLTFRAINPSGRKLYLLRNLWLLQGLKRHALPADAGFLGRADAALGSDPLAQTEHGVQVEPMAIQAAGAIFSDEVIQPNESISRAVVVRLPLDLDAAEITLILPVLTRDPNAPGAPLFRGRTLTWGFTPAGIPVQRLCPDPPSRTAPPCRVFSSDSARDEQALLQQLKRFDPGVQVFHKREQVGLPNGRSTRSRGLEAS
jgi:hypothetical protein